MLGTSMFRPISYLDNYSVYIKPVLIKMSTIPYSFIAPLNNIFSFEKTESFIAMSKVDA